MMNDELKKLLDLVHFIVRFLAVRQIAANDK